MKFHFQGLFVYDVIGFLCFEVFVSKILVKLLCGWVIVGLLFSMLHTKLSSFRRLKI
jgi:hypothetical protein